jgi:outer membrane protein, heavy metal efflux system
MLPFRNAVLLLTAACAGSRTRTIDDVTPPGAIRAEATGPIGAADDAALTRQPTLAVVLRLARSRSPELLELRQRARARASRADVEAALPAPRLKYEQWHVPLARPYALDEAMMIMVGLEQEIPAPGSRAARADAATAEARAGAADAGARELELIRRCKRTFVEYQQVRREIALHQEHLGLARGLIDATRSLYASGRGTQQDVLMAELQATRLHADIVALVQHERSLRALLNSLMVRDPGAPLGEPPPLAPKAVAIDRARLEKAQESRRPELVASARRLDRARAEQRAAERESTWPSFMVGADWMLAPEDEHAHGYGLMVSMDLPWLSGRGRAAERAAVEEARAETQASDSTRIALRYELAEAAAHVEAAAETLKTIEEELLPEAERAWKAARNVFGTAQGNAVALLGTLDAYLQIRLEHARAQAELASSIADVERAVGMELTDE